MATQMVNWWLPPLPLPLIVRVVWGNAESSSSCALGVCAWPLPA
ncbi:MAG: hypothetical protein WDM77_12585 [Steroidobacteraceae bacterium]